MNAPVLEDQHCADTGCNLEDLPGAIDDGNERREKELGNSVPSVRRDGTCRLDYF